MPVASIPESFTSFLGVNLREERKDIGDNDLAVAVNADVHTEPGTPRVREGRVKLFSSQLDSAAVRRLAYVNDTRVHVAGRSVYVDEVKVIDGLLNDEKITTLMAFRPLNDSNEYAFVADRSAMRKITGTTATTWGIAAPTTKPTVTTESVGVGALSGQYTVVYTYVREVNEKVAHESNPSPTSESVQPVASDIRVTNLVASSDSQVTHIYLYRTAAGGSQHLFETKVAVSSRTGITYAFEDDHTSDTTVQFTESVTSVRGDLGGEVFSAVLSWEAQFLRLLTQTDSGAVTSYEFGASGATTLSVLDAGLGTVVEVDNDVPPSAHWAVEHLGYTFLVGDSANPHYLWFSKRFRPESVPSFIEIGSPSDPLVAAYPMRDGLAVFTKQTKYKIVGEPYAGMVPQQSPSVRGTPAPLALIGTELGVVMISRDGAYVTDAASTDTLISEDIQPIFEGTSKNGHEPIDFTRPNDIAAAFHDERLYIAYHGKLGGDWVAVFSGLTKKWAFYQYPDGRAVRSMLVERDTNTFVAGGEDGFVYQLESDDGTGDDGADIAMEIQTRNFTADDPGRRKLYQSYRPDVDADGETVETAFTTDETEKAADDVTGARLQTLLKLPGSCMGFSWRAAFTYTGKKKPKIYGVSAAHQLLETP